MQYSNRSVGCGGASIRRSRCWCLYDGWLKTWSTYHAVFQQECWLWRNQHQTLQVLVFVWRLIEDMINLPCSIPAWVLVVEEPASGTPGVGVCMTVDWRHDQLTMQYSNRSVGCGGASIRHSRCWCLYDGWLKTWSTYHAVFQHECWLWRSQHQTLQVLVFVWRLIEDMINLPCSIPTGVLVVEEPASDTPGVGVCMTVDWRHDQLTMQYSSRSVGSQGASIRHSRCWCLYDGWLKTWSTYHAVFQHECWLWRSQHQALQVLVFVWRLIEDMINLPCSIPTGVLVVEEPASDTPGVGVCMTVDWRHDQLTMQYSSMSVGCGGASIRCSRCWCLYDGWLKTWSTYHAVFQQECWLCRNQHQTLQVLVFVWRLIEDMINLPCSIPTGVLVVEEPASDAPGVGVCMTVDWIHDQLTMQYSNRSVGCGGASIRHSRCWCLYDGWLKTWSTYHAVFQHECWLWRSQHQALQVLVFVWRLIEDMINLPCSIPAWVLVVEEPASDAPGVGVCMTVDWRHDQLTMQYSNRSVGSRGASIRHSRCWCLYDGWLKTWSTYHAVFQHECWLWRSQHQTLQVLVFVWRLIEDMINLPCSIPAWVLVVEEPASDAPGVGVCMTVDWRHDQLAMQYSSMSVGCGGASIRRSRCWCLYDGWLKTWSTYHAVFQQECWFSRSQHQTLQVLVFVWRLIEDMINLPCSIPAWVLVVEEPASDAPGVGVCMTVDWRHDQLTMQYSSMSVGCGGASIRHSRCWCLYDGWLKTWSTYHAVFQQECWLWRSQHQTLQVLVFVWRLIEDMINLPCSIPAGVLVVEEPASGAPGVGVCMTVDWRHDQLTMQYSSRSVGCGGASIRHSRCWCLYDGWLKTWSTYHAVFQQECWLWRSQHQTLQVLVFVWRLIEDMINLPCSIPAGVLVVEEPASDTPGVGVCMTVDWRHDQLTMQYSNRSVGCGGASIRHSRCWCLYDGWLKTWSTYHAVFQQ